MSRGSAALPVWVTVLALTAAPSQIAAIGPSSPSGSSSSETAPGEKILLPDVDPLALDLKIARFLVKHISPKQDPQDRVRSLMDAIFSKKGLDITYENRDTKTAIETFRSRSGNCLSFSLLFVAAARHLGLSASFQEVGEVMSWDRRGEVVLRNHHMYVKVEVENGFMDVDFLPNAEKRYRSVRRASDERVLSHYYNNVGAEKLADGELELAMAYFKKAVEADPSFVHAWTNMGVAHRHLGELGQAEESYRKALELDRHEPTAATNLASLYLSQGRQDEAAPLLMRIDEHLNKNPFYHFRRGSSALRSGDTDAARRHYREAVRRSPQEPEFHAALADVHLRAGEKEKARESLGKALKLAQDEDLRKRLGRELAAIE